MVSMRKHGGVKIVRLDSTEGQESGTDERIRKAGIDGMKIGYRWAYK